jgi:hypothetical protein
VVIAAAPFETDPTEAVLRALGVGAAAHGRAANKASGAAKSASKVARYARIREVAAQLGKKGTAGRVYARMSKDKDAPSLPTVRRALAGE